MPVCPFGGTAHRLIFTRREGPCLHTCLLDERVPPVPAWNTTVRSMATDDPNLSLPTDFNDVGNMEVNACQRASDVVTQKPIRKGFDLVVAERFGKETPDER